MAAQMRWVAVKLGLAQRPLRILWSVFLIQPLYPILNRISDIF